METDCGQTDQGHKGVFAEASDKLAGKLPFRPVCSRSPAAFRGSVVQEK
jgi:hypothetical protein